MPEINKKVMALKVRPVIALIVKIKKNLMHYTASRGASYRRHCNYEEDLRGVHVWNVVELSDPT